LFSKKVFSFFSVLLSLVIGMSSIIIPVNASININKFSPKVVELDNRYLVENIERMLGHGQRGNKYPASGNQYADNDVHNSALTDISKEFNELDKLAAQVAVPKQAVEVIIPSEEHTKTIETKNEDSEIIPVLHDITVTEVDTKKTVADEIYEETETLFSNPIVLDETVIEEVYGETKYGLQGTTQGNGLTGGVLPVRFSM